MAETANVKLYRVDRCGYYPSRSTEAEFGDLRNILDQLHKWVYKAGKSLRDTKTFDIDDAESVDPTYCLDIAKESVHGTFLLVTWNETHSQNGYVPSANGDQPVGETDVALMEVPSGRIPGYPTYFWFVPEYGCFVTIRFENPRNGHENLKEYITHFLYKHTKYVIEGDGSDTDDEILGHSRNGQAGDPEPVTPRFWSRPERALGHIDFIRSNRHRIRKIIRRNALRWQVPKERTLLRRLLDLHDGVAPGAYMEGEAKTKYEVPYNPSEDELEHLIESWQQKSQETRWDDVGFELERDTETYWLGRSLCKDSIEIDVDVDNTGVVQAKHLLQELLKKRHEILKLLP